MMVSTLPPRCRWRERHSYRRRGRAPSPDARDPGDRVTHTGVERGARARRGRGDGYLSETPPTRRSPKAINPVAILGIGQAPRA